MVQVWGFAALRSAGASSATDRLPRRGIQAARLADLRSVWLAGGLGDEPGGDEDLFEVDAVLVAGRVEEVHEVLGGEVAGSTRGVRTAARPARRGVEATDAGAQSGRDVGERRAARVVEVVRD